MFNENFFIRFVPKTMLFLIGELVRIIPCK